MECFGHPKSGCGIHRLCAHAVHQTEGVVAGGLEVATGLAELVVHLNTRNSGVGGVEELSLVCFPS